MGHRRAVAGIAAGIALVLLSGAARADSSGLGYIDACAAALVPSDVKYNSNDVLKLSLLREMMSSSSDNSRFDTNGEAYFGMFGGGTNGAQDAERRLSEKLNYDIDHKHQLSIIASYLSPDSAGAFNDCVRTAFASPGLRISVEDSDETTTNIAIHYVPGPNNSQNARLQIISNGDVHVPSYDVPAGGFTNPLVIGVSRRNAARDLAVYINIVTPPDPAHPQGFPLASAGAIFPPHVETSESTVGHWLVSPRAQANCYNSVVNVPTGDLVPDAGYRFDTQKTIAEVVDEGRPYGLEPGPPSGAYVNVNKADLVNGTITCAYAPGHWNAYYNVQGVVRAWEQSTTVSIKSPTDNGAATTWKVYPDPRH